MGPPGIRWLAALLVTALCAVGCDGATSTETPDPPGAGGMGGGDPGPTPEPAPEPTPEPEAPLDPPGAPCDGPDDCASGLCVPVDGAGQCTIPCPDEGDECPDGWYCGESVAFGEPVCLPGNRALCAPCEVDDACGGSDDLCLPLMGTPGVSACAADCTDTLCPDGYDCVEVGGGQQCVPSAGTCPVEPIDEPDGDRDGVPDAQDNCLDAENPDQADRDLDGVGDACDDCPDEAGGVDDGCPSPPGMGPTLVHGHMVAAMAIVERGAWRLWGVISADEPPTEMRNNRFRIRSLSLGEHR